MILVRRLIKRYPRFNLYNVYKKINNEEIYLYKDCINKDSEILFKESMQRRESKLEYIRYWLETYSKHFKESDRLGKLKIRKELFDNIHLTDDEKEKVWEIIVIKAM